MPSKNIIDNGVRILEFEYQVFEDILKSGEAPTPYITEA